MNCAKQYRTKKWLMLLVMQLIAIVFAHAQFNPTEIEGLQLWLRADSGVVFNGNFVSQWSDLSGHNRHATSSVDVIRPTLTMAAINGEPAVTFDGVEDFLEFPVIDDVRTVFWILREHPDATSITSRPLLGWSGGFNFLRGDNQYIFSGQYSSPQVFNGSTRLNGSNINSATTLLNPGFNLVSLVTAGDVQANHLTMESNIYGRTWWGDFAEVIIYNEPLTETQVSQVENYLMQRYAPTYVQFDDIIMGEVLCDTTVCIPSAFQNVIWNNQAVGNCIDIDSSGVYTVTFEDVFGRTFNDTLEVHYALDNTSVEAVFCTGELYTWTSPESSFGLVWDGESVENVSSSSIGSHVLVVSDLDGCSRTIAFELSEDMFSSDYAIATQPLYCSGAVLQIAPSLPIGTSVVWNNTMVQATYQLEQSGEFTVLAINSNECEMRDTLAIALAGASSVIQLSADGMCKGTAVVLDATATIGEPLVAGVWQFGDDLGAEVLQVSHTYNLPGSYVVEFNGINAAGCSSFGSMEVIIHELPSIGLEAIGQCAHVPIDLHAVGNSSDGQIVTYDWLVDGEFFEGQDIQVVLDAAGFNNLIVAATTEYGCSAEWSQLYLVNESPSVLAGVDSVCHGALNQFAWQLIDSGNNQNAVTVAWEFGDGTGSLQTQPFHYFTFPNTYDALVMTTNSSGCVDTTLLTAVVFELPQADFLVTNFCIGESKELIDMSTAAFEDPLQDWLWLIDGSTEWDGQQPMVVFADEGLHAVRLTITTEHGCTADVIQQIPVWPLPNVNFSWEPLISGAPWSVPFEASSDLGVSYSWYFGDGSVGLGQETEHLFGMNGTYNVQLTGMTTMGCSQSVSQILTVANPVLDVSVLAVQVVEQSDGQEIQVQLRNNGNIKLDELMMSWQLGGDAPVIETWEASLSPGETSIFTFTSRVTTIAAHYPYLCVYAETSPWLVNEVNVTDNAFCKPLVSGGLELFAPYPNPGDERMFVRLIAPATGNMVMHVFDNKGQEVLRFDDLEVNKGFQQFFIDISALANGTYRLIAEMDNAKSVVSFLKLAR